jgi:hypothetical protein
LPILTQFEELTVMARFGIMITIICAVILFVFADNFLNLPSQLNKNIAYAHFFGKQKTIDNYRIVFQPSSSTPSAGENATLNFSILVKDNLNVNNVYAALIIKEKNTGKVVGQIPYKFYEFSDITFPYKFQNNLDYTANLESRISGDPKYEAKPLIADFDIFVGNPLWISFKELMLYYVTPTVVIVPVGIVLYQYIKKKNLF